MVAPTVLASDRPIEASSASVGSRAPRPFFWSVRCELWRSRWVMLGPLPAALVLVTTTLLGALSRPSRLGALLGSAAAGRHAAIAEPYALAAPMVALGVFLVGLIYSLDALRGERRDRSILFWKSLPVSDATVVLAKAAIVFVVLPLVVLAVTVVVHAALLLIGSTTLILTGGNPLALWRELALGDRLVAVLYGVVTLALQQAQLYGWLLMVSAWAPRLPALWALLPPFAIVEAERRFFGHSRLEELLRDLVVGSFTRSFDLNPSRTTMPAIRRVAELGPAALFGRPALWLGLVLTAVFLGLAIRSRHDREPV